MNDDRSWLREGLKKIEDEVREWPEWKRNYLPQPTVVYQEKEELPL